LELNKYIQFDAFTMQVKIWYLPKADTSGR